MEDELFNLFKNFNMRGTVLPDMVLQMMRSMEYTIWTQLSVMAQKRLEELSGQNTRPSGQQTDMDPFAILGVSMDVTEDELNTVYRERAKKAHPDKGGTNEEMAKVNAAYEVIKRFKGWGRT